MIAAGSSRGRPDASTPEALREGAPTALAESRRRSTGLPVARTSFVGREHEVAAVADLLQGTGDEREAAYTEYLLGVAAEDRGDYGTGDRAPDRCSPPPARVG